MEIDNQAQDAQREQASPGLGVERWVPLHRGTTHNLNEFFPGTCILTFFFFFLRKKIHFTNFFINSWGTCAAGEGKGQGARWLPTTAQASPDGFPLRRPLLGGVFVIFPAALVAGVLV